MKGITPVVALILLLLITVAIVGFASGFFTRVFTTTSQQTQKELEQFGTVSGQTFRIENAKDFTITVRSTGSGNIPGSSLAVYADGVQTACPFPATINSGALASCTLAASCSGKTVRVVGNANEESTECI